MSLHKKLKEKTIETINELIESIPKKQKNKASLVIPAYNEEKRTAEDKAEMSREIMETMLKKSGLLVSKHKIIIFSDKTLFQWNRMLETSKKLIEILRQKKSMVVIITSKSIDQKYKDYFNSIIKIESNETPEK